MSKPSKEAVEAAEDVCSMLGDKSTIREAVRVQSAIDAATAPLRDEIRLLLGGIAIQQERCTEAVTFLDAAGLGKIGESPHGNTLVGMAHEASELIPQLRARIRELEDAIEGLLMPIAKTTHPCWKSDGQLHQPKICIYCDGIRAIKAQQQEKEQP